MEEEISFAEFNSYYKDVMSVLADKNESFEEDDIWKALFIIENLMSNADSRASESKGSTAKKYKKMSERTTLWSKNLASRLHKFGYTEEQINERFEGMLEEGTVKAE
ncbi:hypothetical protein KH400_14210 [Desertibacillus haloalkaliphilus]|nr:hypothetical protein [Desertibacillus haloalkaliphilus]